jgi:hypothetical protein
MPDVPLGPYRESVAVTIDTNAVGPMLESKTDAIMQALATKMDFTTARLQQVIVDDKLQGQLLNHRLGHLSNSVRPTETVATADEISGGVVAGGTGAPYARALEYGSRAHLIRAVNAKALQFEVSGASDYSPWGGLFSKSDSGMIYVKQVMHPGTRAYAFMRGTLDEQAQEIQAGFQQAAAEGANS